MGWARREGIGLDDALSQEPGARSQEPGASPPDTSMNFVLFLPLFCFEAS
jgi:hypothetical protein